MNNLGSEIKYQEKTTTPHFHKSNKSVFLGFTLDYDAAFRAQTQLQVEISRVPFITQPASTVIQSINIFSTSISHPF